MNKANLETNGNQLCVKQKLLEEKQDLIGRKEEANWKTADT
jgi:predicted component of type VI protein secretion system